MKKKILIPQRKRKPKEYLSYQEIIKTIMKKTGFREVDIRAVVETYTGQIAEGIESKRQVSIAGVGTIYPVIKPSRVGMSLKGGVGKPSKVIVPDRWMVRFHASRDMTERMKDVEVLSEELELIYK